jgi:hypothetical protein
MLHHGHPGSVLDHDTRLSRPPQKGPDGFREGATVDVLADATARAELGDERGELRRRAIGEDQERAPRDVGADERGDVGEA